MKRIILSILCCSIISIPAIASMYDNFTPQQKAMMQNEISFYQKLKTCTPASHKADRYSLKINGLKNGNCEWVLSLGLSSDFDLKCSGPTSATSQFADLKIEYLKDMYGLNPNSSFDSFNKIANDKYTDKYCK